MLNTENPIHKYDVGGFTELEHFALKTMQMHVRSMGRRHSFRLVLNQGFYLWEEVRKGSTKSGRIRGEIQ